MILARAHEHALYITGQGVSPVYATRYNFRLPHSFTAL